MKWTLDQVNWAIAFWLIAWLPWGNCVLGFLLGSYMGFYGGRAIGRRIWPKKCYDPPLILIRKDGTTITYGDIFPYEFSKEAKGRTLHNTEDLESREIWKDFYDNDKF
jgi:hypothetical protein